MIFGFSRHLRHGHQSCMPPWTIPFVYSAAAVVIGLGIPRIEQHWVQPLSSSLTVASATAMYSGVAAGMITLTGIVFSLVFVVIQFSSAAYSPRLVTFIARDPVMFHAIGVFTATFLYALAALAWVDRFDSGRVPLLSAYLVMGLLLASVGIFVALVRRLSRLHISNILSFTGDFGRGIIDRLYPPLSVEIAASSDDFRLRPVSQTLRYAGPPRAIESVDTATLSALAEESDGVIELISAVGDTIVEDTLLLRVYGGRLNISERAMRKAIRTGKERTFEQDPKYAIRLLVDIAIRALSPAVNDPSTAVQALDQIEDLLVRLGRRRLEIMEIRDRTGRLRLVIPFPTWEDFLHLALDEIRTYGSSSVQVMRRMKALLSDLSDAVPENRREAVQSQQRRLIASVGRCFTDADDQLEASVEDREGLGIPRKRIAAPEKPGINGTPSAA